MRNLAAVSVALSALASCRLPPAGTIDVAEVEALLAAQTGAWARGDFEAFVTTYWDDERMTFVGREGVTRGTADLAASYRRGYPDAAHRGELSFELIEVRPLAGDFALVIGRYRLARTAGDASGMFTLVVERRPEGLRIVHDHSSSSEPAER